MTGVMQWGYFAPCNLYCAVVILHVQGDDGNALVVVVVAALLMVSNGVVVV